MYFTMYRRLGFPKHQNRSRDFYTKRLQLSQCRPFGLQTLDHAQNTVLSLKSLNLAAGPCSKHCTVAQTAHGPCSKHCTVAQIAHGPCSKHRTVAQIAQYHRWTMLKTLYCRSNRSISLLEHASRPLCARSHRSSTHRSAQNAQNDCPSMLRSAPNAQNDSSRMLRSAQNAQN